MTITQVSDSVETAPPAPPPAGATRTIWPILALIAIPTVVFVGANLFGGHLLLSGDNLIQSYPLRVVVGADLRNGVWPWWDPWIWSGTPLTAGLNAGALYPATLLFAVLSGSQAWVVGEILIFSSIGVGTYLLLRAGGTTPLASFLGAASFAFAGAVADQTAVHLDMGEGFVALPWALLAIRHIGSDGRWRWAVLLGVSTAVLVLAGSPEAIVDVVALSLAYAAVRWSLRRESWWLFMSRGAVAGALGIGLTAFVWIPALHFIDTSQQRPPVGVVRLGVLLSPLGAPAVGDPFPRGRLSAVLPTAVFRLVEPAGSGAVRRHSASRRRHFDAYPTVAPLAPRG